MIDHGMGGIFTRQIKLPNEMTTIRLISDVHLGSPQCDSQSFYRDVVHSDCDRMLFNGDLFDAVAASDPRMQSSRGAQTDTPLNDDIELASDIISTHPNVDLLGVGNHETRIHTNAGFCPVQQVAMNTRNKKAYGAYMNFITYKMGNKSFTIAAHHGCKGGLKTIFNRLSWVVSDVVWVGHYHQLSIGSQVKMMAGAQGKLVYASQLHLSTGAYLQCHQSNTTLKANTYAVVAGFAATAGRYIDIVICPSGTGQFKTASGLGVSICL